MRMTTALLTSLMMLICVAPRAAFAVAPVQREFTEREEANQTYRLTAGARVEVSSIRGSVDITTSDSDTAEVTIIRTARTRADLDYHKIEVEQTGNSLVVRGIQEPEERRHKNVQVNHHVILRLPRRIDLTVNSISGTLKSTDLDGPTRVNSVSGSVELGNVNGKLQVNSVSGNVDVGNVGADARVNSVSGSVGLGQVDGSLEVTSVSGSLNVTLASLSPQGIHIKSVSGSVEIGFKTDVNADFRAESVSGKVHLDFSNVILDTSESNSSNVHARIGSGGTPIVISSVSGSIRVTRS